MADLLQTQLSMLSNEFNEHILPINRVCVYRAIHHIIFVSIKLEVGAKNRQLCSVKVLVDFIDSFIKMLRSEAL